MTYKEFCEKKENLISECNRFRREMPIGTIFVQYNHHSNECHVLKIISREGDYTKLDCLCRIRLYEYREEFKALPCLEY